LPLYFLLSVNSTDTDTEPSKYLGLAWQFSDSFFIETINQLISTMQKTSFLLLILVFSSMSFSVFGQQVTLNLTNVNLENVLTSISGQTDYTFSYNTQSINLTQKTSIKVSDLPLEEALQELFSGTKINYEVQGSNKILLTPKREDQSKGNHTQLKTVQGTVTDESGLPLPGATIMEKGTSNGVSADF